jgi:hypothetical protein
LLEVVVRLGEVEEEGEGRTVFGEFLDDFHGADDAGLFAVGVVEKGLVAGVHAPHVVAG